MKRQRDYHILPYFLISDLSRPTQTILEYSMEDKYQQLPELKAIEELSGTESPQEIEAAEGRISQWKILKFISDKESKRVSSAELRQEYNVRSIDDPLLDLPLKQLLRAGRLKSSLGFIDGKTSIVYWVPSNDSHSRSRRVENGPEVEGEASSGPS